MTGKHIPHFGLNSLISTLSFGEIFSYFASSWKWYCLTFWIGKKSRLFRRFFQYSVICHFSKYIRLALTDFHKHNVFYRKYMWLQLRHVWKEFTEGNAFCFFVLCWRHKIRKTLMLSVERAHITWAFVILARAVVKLWGATSRWLTRVFLRLNSTRYHCLPDVSINRACKNNAINLKKKRKLLQDLKGVKSLR